MKKTSQCDRVLDVLRDGRWHRMEEIHARAGFMRLNSRVSELRARGLDIRCDREGGVYKYRLIGPLPQPSEKVSSDNWTSGNSEGVGSGRTAEKRPVGSRPVQTCGSPAPPEQMSLLEAA
jgi:hypothetical protein